MSKVKKNFNIFYIFYKVLIIVWFGEKMNKKNLQSKVKKKIFTFFFTFFIKFLFLSGLARKLIFFFSAKYTRNKTLSYFTTF